MIGGELSFDSPFSLGGAVSHFGQPPGEVAFGSQIPNLTRRQEPFVEPPGDEGWFADHDSGSSSIHSTTGRGNGCEDIRENCASKRPKKRHEFPHERGGEIMIANGLLIALAL